MKVCCGTQALQSREGVALRLWCVFDLKDCLALVAVTNSRVGECNALFFFLKGKN